jgi:hypothetical protein
MMYEVVAERVMRLASMAVNDKSSVSVTAGSVTI